MSNKEKATALFALAADADRPQAERRAAWNELNALKRSSKTSFEKLGIDTFSRSAVATQLLEGDEPFEAAFMGKKVDPLDEVLADKGTTKAEVAKAIGVKAPVKLKDATAKADDHIKTRGQISELTKLLLTSTELGYAEIVDKVKLAHPKANTTTRSVASVASEMRAKGLKVPTRRVAAKKEG